MTPFFKRHWDFLKPLWKDRDGEGLIMAVCSKRREDPVSYLAVADRAAEMDLPKIERAFRFTAEFLNYKGSTISQLPIGVKPAMTRVLRNLGHTTEWVQAAKIMMCDLVKLWPQDTFWYLSLTDCYSRNSDRLHKKIIMMSTWATAYAYRNSRTDERTIHVHPLRITHCLYWMGGL